MRLAYIPQQAGQECLLVRGQNFFDHEPSSIDSKVAPTFLIFSIRRRMEASKSINMDNKPKSRTTNSLKAKMEVYLPISVIVCTRDRPHALAGCLQSLARLDYPIYEVIIVDNAPRDDQTARLVAETPFRYVREDRPGLDWARNRGAAEASYDLIAYTDDDVQVCPGWLRGIATAFADPTVMAVTGLVLPLELETPAQRLFEQYSGMGKGEQPRTFRREQMQPGELIAVHHVGVGANMAFRRRVFEISGGFDPALDVGTPAAGGGDLDMFHRVLIAGLTLRYEPTAIVRHRHRREMAALRRQLYQNGRSFGVHLLKIWHNKTVSRWETVLFAARWLGGWLLARLFQRLIGRLDFPLGLVWAELWGALHAPWAYWATYKLPRNEFQGCYRKSVQNGLNLTFFNRNDSD